MIILLHQDNIPDKTRGVMRTMGSNFDKNVNLKFEYYLVVKRKRSFRFALNIILHSETCVNRTCVRMTMWMCFGEYIEASM